MNPVKKWAVFMFFSVMSLTASVSAQILVPMIEPGVIMVPAERAYKIEEVRKAIIAGAMRNHWRMESEMPGVVRLILDGRKDRAVLMMDVVYDVKSYDIKYVMSEALRYEKGDAPASNPNSNTVSRSSRQDGPIIHPSFARWMKNLVNAINIELNIMKI